MQQNILGTYLHFKDARQAARDALSGESSQNYDVYIEGKVGDQLDFQSHNDSKAVCIMRKDEEDDIRGDTDFCIYTWSLNGELCLL